MINNMRTYADLHLHVSLTHYVNELGNIWFHKEFDPQHDRPNRCEAEEFTQSDVHSLISGKVTLSVAALYAIEDIVDETFFSKFIAKWFFGFKLRKVKKLRDSFKTKFALLNHDKDFILKGPQRQGNKEYMVAQKKADLTSGAIKNKLVFCIEGAHNFHGGGQPGSQLFEQEILANLSRVKQWEHPVFMLTLCHFQYNQMAGQAWAIPLPKIVKPILKKSLDSLGRPNHSGITALGWKVISKALDKTNGYRILIDLKHSSVETRKEYYQFIKSNGLKGVVPIIISHTGVSGIDTFQNQITNVDNKDPHAAKHFQKFNPWAINICDEDIKEVVDIGGIIGISMDQRILGENNKTFKKSIREILRHAGISQNSKNLHCCLWLENIFHIVLTADMQSAWDIICMSSDFGGVIDPIDSCPTTKHLSEFEGRLNQIAYHYYKNSAYLGNIFVIDQQDLNNKIRRILYDNLQQFVIKHFPV